MDYPNLYNIDKGLIDDVAKALSEKDKYQLLYTIELLRDRAEGRCFCAARSPSDCSCGAWDGEWNTTTNLEDQT